MPTAAVIGYNTDFSIYNGSAYVLVAEVTSITWPGYSRDAIDATNMNSEDQFREYIPGLMDAGEVTIEMNYVPNHADAIIAALTASAVGQYKIAAANGANVVFTAIVTAYQPQAPVDDKMTASATFKITGKPTWAAA
jgi:predicted secreted protein